MRQGILGLALLLLVSDALGALLDVPLGRRESQPKYSNEEEEDFPPPRGLMNLVEVTQNNGKASSGSFQKRYPRRKCSRKH